MKNHDRIFHNWAEFHDRKIHSTEPRPVENLWKKRKGRPPFGFGVPLVFLVFDVLEFVVVEVDLHRLVDVEFLRLIAS